MRVERERKKEKGRESKEKGSLRKDNRGERMGELEKEIEME
jgi:hypothetical protein